MHRAGDLARQDVVHLFRRQSGCDARRCNRQHSTKSLDSLLRGKRKLPGYLIPVGVAQSVIWRRSIQDSTGFRRARGPSRSRSPRRPGSATAEKAAIYERRSLAGGLQRSAARSPSLTFSTRAKRLAWPPLAVQ